jgi:hypothetical protein
MAHQFVHIARSVIWLTGEDRDQKDGQHRTDDECVSEVRKKRAHSFPFKYGWLD